MVRPRRRIAALILGSAVLVMLARPAQAQFPGSGFGYGELEYGGYGYGGLGYEAGFGGRAFGVWPGIGFSYGFPGYHGWGAGGALIASPYSFGYPVQGYGYGYYNPDFPYGLSPIAVQTAIGRAQLNRALRTSAGLGGVPVLGGGVSGSR